MYGMLVWTEKGKRAVELKQEEILRVPFLCAAVRRAPRMPESLLRRRVKKALGILRKQGIGRIVTPRDFIWQEELRQYGISPVTTMALRRELAAEWMDAALLARGTYPAGTKAAVYAHEITGELVQTVKELSLRHRYVVLCVKRGGEELARRLRREYGVSLELAHSGAELEGTGAVAAFAPLEGVEHPLVLRLYDEQQPLPELSLPVEIAAQLPRGVPREQVLAVLRETGRVRKGEISIPMPVFGADKEGKAPLTFPEGTSIILDCHNGETMGKSRHFPLKRYVKGLPTWKKNTE